MKRSYNEYLLPLLALAGTWLTACSEDGTDPANPYEGNFTLTTQAEVDAFPARREANRITVTGGDITDLSSLDVSAVGTLVIRNTGIGTLTLPKTFSVATKLEIAENESLVSVGDLALRFVIGDIHIEDNPQLTDISGLMNLKKMTGKLFVTGNSLLGEDKPDQPDTYGFNVIKYLISNSVLDSDNVTLSNNHPLAVTDPSLIGQGGESGGVYSYTIKSDAEAAAFSPSGKEVKDLTVTGPQVTDDGMALLASKIDVVQGTMTIDGAAIKTTETFFGKVECRGGIVLRNIETYDEDSGNKFFNNNGFKNITQVGGDFVLENIPYLIHWGSGNGFAQIVRVEGDLTVRNCGMQQMAFASLSEVGGDMTLEDNCVETYQGFFWNLATDLRRIGGNLTLIGNDHQNGLGGFEKLEYLGGDITIAECGTDVSAGGGIPYVSVAGQVGFDLVERWIVSGVVQPGAAVDCRYADGSSVEFSEVPDPGAPRTYTIAGRDELLAFVPQDGSAVGETVQDLTILDPDNTISDHDLSFVKNRVGKIAGTLTVEGTSLTTTEVLFNDGGFTVDGGIVFRNCAQLFNLNGMKSMTAVGGDLVFENCPKITTNWGAGNCLSQIESVAGSGRRTDGGRDFPFAPERRRRLYGGELQRRLLEFRRHAARDGGRQSDDPRQCEAQRSGRFRRAPERRRRRDGDGQRGRVGRNSRGIRVRAGGTRSARRTLPGGRLLLRGGVRHRIQRNELPDRRIVTKYWQLRFRPETSDRNPENRNTDERIEIHTIRCGLPAFGGGLRKGVGPEPVARDSAEAHSRAQYGQLRLLGRNDVGRGAAQLPFARRDPDGVSRRSRNLERRSVRDGGRRADAPLDRGQIHRAVDLFVGA